MSLYNDEASIDDAEQLSISYNDPIVLANQFPWPTCSNQSATMTKLL